MIATHQQPQKKQPGLLLRFGYVLYAIYSFFYLQFFFLNTAIIGVFVISITLLTNRQNFVYLVGRFWAQFNLLCTGVRMTVEGEENIQPNQPYILMANHQSLYDVWAIIGYVPMQLRWVIKKELRKWPIFGIGCFRMGHIFVERGFSEVARNSLHNAAKRIRSGTSVAFFPEGTRSSDGRLLPFKKGGFHVAAAAQVPILPVTVLGGRHILAKGSAKLRPGPMHIVIHPPIPVTQDNSDPAKRRELIEKVRATISTRLETE